MLDGAVLQYLNTSGYKLSALTFSEEAGHADEHLRREVGTTLQDLYHGWHQLQAALSTAQVMYQQSVSAGFVSRNMQ